MRKVRIKTIPKAQSGLDVKMKEMTSGRGMMAGLGLNSNTMPWPVMAGQLAEPNIEVNTHIKGVPREEANLEAEKGETAFTDKVGDGIPQLYKIGGKRHYDGGTPLDLPEDSFIYSRDKKMKIGGPILESFGKHKDTKDKFTPADLSKQYDINEYRKVLADPNTDKLQRDTAELMITNYNLKLGKLGLVQESKKGFPDGIPKIAMPFIETMQVDPTQFMMQNPQGQGPQGMTEQPAADNTARYGGIPKAQYGYATEADYKKHLTDPYSKKKAQDQMVWNVAHPVVTPTDQNDYTKQLQDINALEQYNTKSTKELKEKNDYQAALDKARQKAQHIEDVKQKASNIDFAIKRNLELTTRALKGEKVLWGSDEAPANVLTLKQELIGLTKQQKDLLNTINAFTPTKSSTWTKEQYDASLLDKTMPYDKKHQAQMDFLMANPQYVQHATASNVNIPPVQPASTAPISSSDLINTQGTPTQQTTPADTAETVTVQEDFKMGGSYASGGGDKKIVRWEVSAKSGNKRPVYADGSYGPVEKGTAPVVTKSKGTSTQANPLATGKEPYSMSEAYGPKGVARLNDFLVEYGLPKLALTATKEEIQKAVGNMQAKTIESNPVLVSHYMQNAVEPNNKLRAILKSKGYGTTKTDLQKALKEGNITPEEIRGGYKDDQWWHRAVGTNQKVLSKEDYDKKMNDPNVIKQGNDIFSIEDPTHPEVYTKYVTTDNAPDAPASADEAAPIVKNELGKPYQTPGPEWWLQDKVKTAGAFADLMRIKKYNPWQATPGVNLPEGTFYDPTRELAANAEQVNLGVQGASTFSGPQSFAATAGYLQGQGARNVADIMGKYNNLNVTESNRLGDETAGILNQAAQQKAGNATQLFDKQTIVNQQFDNAKNEARQNLRQGFIDAITNRANTYNLNTMYPQYAVDPNSGGMVYNIPGSNRELNKNYKGQETPEEAMSRIHNIKGLSDTEKMHLYDSMYGKGRSGPSADDMTGPQSYRS